MPKLDHESFSPEIHRRRFLSAAVLGTAARACGRSNEAPQAPSPGPPNILLLLFPDQLRGMAMGCMGDPDVKAPNLDKLASKGLPFPKIVEYRFDGVLCGTGIDLTRERSSQRDAISGVPTTPMNKTASVASAAFAWNGYFSPPRRSPPPAQMAEQD